MADSCSSKVTQSLIASCAALQKVGGLNKLIYIANMDDVSLLLDENGYVSYISFTGSPAGNLYKFSGKVFKNSYTIEGEVGENVSTFNPALAMVLYYYTPAERVAIETLFKAEQLVVIVETNGGEGKGMFEVFGFANGLKASAFSAGSGVTLNDSTSATITLSGQEDELPKVLKIGDLFPTDSGYIAENRARLEAWV